MTDKTGAEKSGGNRSGWKKYRSLLEWGVVLCIVLLLYGSGWHTEVIGRLQQAVLWTGIMQADTEIPLSEQRQASYDYKLITLDGNRGSLSEFRDKVIFLNFWATWCSPCIAEMPNIQSLYEEYRNDDRITFVMVSLDEDFEKAYAFVENRDFSFPVYFPAGSRPSSLQSSIIPTTYVIDRSGSIATTREGMANYNTSKFKAFLENLLADPEQ